MLLQRNHSMALVRELVPRLDYQVVANAGNAFILENVPCLKWDSCAIPAFIHSGRGKVKFCASQMELLLAVSAYCHTRNLWARTAGIHLLAYSTGTHKCVSVHKLLCVTGCVHKSSLLPPPPLPLQRLFPIIVPCSSDIWHKRKLCLAWPPICSGQTLVKHN